MEVKDYKSAPCATGQRGGGRMLVIKKKNRSYRVTKARWVSYTPGSARLGYQYNQRYRERTFLRAWEKYAVKLSVKGEIIELDSNIRHIKIDFINMRILIYYKNDVFRDISISKDESIILEAVPCDQ
jgi:hypothetical protein